MEDHFTHLDEKGNPSMVDVGSKAVSKRIAIARSIILLDDTILNQFENDDIKTKKGPVFQTAIIAGVMAAKKTSELIPLCHPIGLDNCLRVSLGPSSSGNQRKHPCPFAR